MAYYTDTNAMWRRFVASDPRQSLVKAAMDALLRQGETLAVSAQNMIEFRGVATRPAEMNGLGLTTQAAREMAQEMEAFFTFLPDTPAIYSHWRTLVETYEVKGKQVHDARIVAVMLAHGMTHLLTFNVADFRRFSEITVVEPKDMPGIAVP